MDNKKKSYKKKFSQLKPTEATTNNLGRCGYLFTSDEEDGVVKQYDIETHKYVTSYNTGKDTDIHTIHVTRNSRYLFVSFFHILKQFRIANQKLVHDYGKINKNKEMDILTSTSDSKYLFISFVDGSVEQYDIEKQEQIKIFGKIDGEIYSMTTTNDCRYLFINSSSVTVKQFSIKKLKLEFEYKRAGSTYMSLENSEIKSNIIRLTASNDSKYLFAQSGIFHILATERLQYLSGLLYQFNIKRRSLLYIYDLTGSLDQNLLLASNDNKYLFKDQKQFNIQTRKLVYDYKSLLPSEISNTVNSSSITNDSKYVFFCSQGYVLQFDIKNGEIVHDYGLINNNMISPIVTT